MGQRAATSPQASRQKQTRRYRLRGPLRRLRLAAAFCLLSLCRIVAHDNQGTVPVVVELKTKPQEALEQVLWEEHQETEEPNPFLWLKKRLRENGSFSEMLRETIYTGEIERLNPTCAVIGLLLRTVPICPFVRRLEKYILDTPPSLNKFFQHALQPTPEMNAYLPEPLAVYPDMLPAIIDERVADAERHTIYWYYAMVTRAWQHMADILRPDAAVDAGRPPLEFSDFPDWNLADGWTTGRLMKSQTGVFAVSMAKDGHLVVLMRGSTTDEVGLLHSSPCSLQLSIHVYIPLGKLFWEIGDFVVQVPWDCFPIPDCVNDSSETYMYAYHGGLVKITPRMMPNEDGWIKEANWIGDFQIGFQGMVATHMCSYWCWATRGLPPPYEGSNCYFPGDKNHIGPPTDICLSST
ncbi:lipase-related protein [Nannochloropsis oceanica]